MPELFCSCADSLFHGNPKTGRTLFLGDRIARDLYGTDGLPTTFVTDKNQVVRAVIKGRQMRNN